MKMCELAEEYRACAAQIADRLGMLRRQLETGRLCAMERYRLCRRMEMLAGMQRELRATAYFMEHYYERACVHGRPL